MMFNVLLDEYPNQYKGYRIDGDFQIGIQITQCLEDEELSEYERIATACNLLYIEFPEDINLCVEGLTWFLNSWDHDKHKKESTNVKAMDFDVDQWRIYSAFKSQYGIDLNKERLHWFAFMGLISNLEECAFTRVVSIRTKPLAGKMSSDEKKALQEAKKIYSIRNNEIDRPLSVAEQKAVEDFMKYANIKK